MLPEKVGVKTEDVSWDSVGTNVNFVPDKLAKASSLSFSAACQVINPCMSDDEGM